MAAHFRLYNSIHLHQRRQLELSFHELAKYPRKTLLVNVLGIYLGDRAQICLDSLLVYVADIEARRRSALVRRRPLDFLQ